MAQKFNSCCRLCLTSERSLKNVFQQDNCNDLLQKILSSIGITIKSEDKVTVLICEQCTMKVKSWNNFRRICLDNQVKLNHWFTKWNSSQRHLPVIQIKDEPIDLCDDDDDVMPSTEAPLLTTNDSMYAKMEPIINGRMSSMSIPDLSPEVSIDASEIDELAPPLLRPEEDPLGIARKNRRYTVDSKKALANINNKRCTICTETFASLSHRLIHERTIHGVGIERTGAGEDDDDDHGRQLPPVLTQRAPPNRHQTENDKIQFAAGLCLQSKSATPARNMNGSPITRIEENYLTKCKIIISVFHRNICTCHNFSFPDTKRLVSHVRKLSCWYPPYTCLNCLMSFTGRGSMVKHKNTCQRLPLENLIKLSELRGGDANKMRLYQHFKCAECHAGFAFYEDYCNHVYYDHMTDDVPHVCRCAKTFHDEEVYKAHAFNDCYISYRCDICFVDFANRDEFKQHSVDNHDHVEQFDFFQLHPDFYVMSNIEIAKLLLDKAPKEATSTVTASQENDAPVEVQQRQLPDLLEVPADEGSQHAVTNGHYEEDRPAKGDYTWKFVDSECLECPKVYSTFNNMMRHMKVGHGYTPDTYPTPVKCKQCNQFFDSIMAMCRHRVSHVVVPNDTKKQSLLNCVSCKKSFASNAELRKHIATDHASFLHSIAADPPPLETKRKRGRSMCELHTCTECGDTFQNATDLESHRATHLNLRLYRDSKTHSYRSKPAPPQNATTCTVCHKSFTSAADFTQHMKLHDEMPVLEPQLDEAVDNVKNRKSLSYPRPCELCGKVMATGGGYGSHMLMHRRQGEVGALASVAAVPPAAVTESASSSKSAAAAAAANSSRKDDDAHRSSSSSSSKNSNQDGDTDYHTCHRCFKIFTNRYKLKNHMKSHGVANKSPTRTGLKGATKLFWCNLCHKPCHGDDQYQKHMMSHRSEMNGIPKLIDQVTPNAPDIKPQVFSCDVCTKYFSSKSGLRKHKDRHHNNHIEEHHVLQRPAKMTNTCRHCKVAFSSIASLQQHMESEHCETLTAALKANSGGTNSKTTFKCPICKKNFKAMAALQSHFGWHRRADTAKSQLKPDNPDLRPMNEVADQMAAIRFRCKSCPMWYSNDTALQIHILEVHRNVNATIVQAAVCHSCDLVFDSQKELDRHCSEVHVPPPLQQQQRNGGMQCNYCDMIFNKGDTLAQHVKLCHSTVKPEYVCHLCNRSFDRANSLALHVKAHDRPTFDPAAAKSLTKAAPKTYTCSICQVQFLLPKDLRNHIIITHPF